jgi:beta-glucosidase
MTIEEKASQMMQGDMTNWLNITDGSFNETGLIFNMENRAGQFYVGQPISWELLADAIAIGQAYLVNNTRLGIPAFVSVHQGVKRSYQHEIGAN